jgi:hypothetical protein
MKPDEENGTATFAALGDTNIHIRGGAAVLLHQEPGYVVWHQNESIRIELLDLVVQKSITVSTQR